METLRTLKFSPRGKWGLSIGDNEIGGTAARDLGLW